MTRDPGGLGDFPGDDLASQVPDDLRRRPDKHQARIGAGFGKIGVFRQKPVTGMNGLGPGLLGGENDLVDIEVVLPGAGPDAHRFIGPHDMEGVLVGLLVDGHHLEAQFLGAPHDPHRDLAAVGHQNLAKYQLIYHGCPSLSVLA